MAALVSNAMDLYKNGQFANSSLQSAEKEFLAALLLSADDFLSWKQVFDAAYAESFILCYDLGNRLQEMISDGQVAANDNNFKATEVLKNFLSL